MAVVRIKGFQIWKDRKSPFKWRCRHRKSGTMIDTTKFPLGSMSFMAECSRIVEMLDKANNAKPGTLGMLITRYRESVAFQDLAYRTKSDYQRVFDYLQPIADTATNRFTPPLVVKIRDKAAEKHGRRFGNYVKQVMSSMFSWCLERGYIKTNPAFNIKSIRRPKGMPDANRPWSDQERLAVLDALPPHMTLPIVLMMYCGLDPQDALSLPRTAIANGCIDTQRGKTGVPLWLPLPSAVSLAIETAPEHSAETLCANSYGKPWTYSGYSTNWSRLKKTLEEEGRINSGLTLKGLRHTVATTLREMGVSYDLIAGMLGQKTEAMAKHYSRRADMSKKLNSTITDLDAEWDRRDQEVSNQHENSVKPKGMVQ